MTTGDPDSPATVTWGQRVLRRALEWRPAAPPLPEHLEGILRPDDPEWFARELAIAAAPP
jgi:1-acyl-sn-glycerol-3-phosphate acyltransferase